MPSSTSRSHRRLRKGTAAFIPPNILKSERLVALATRINMTPAQQAAYTEAFIDEVGGDVRQVASSYSTADKCRRKVADNIALTEKVAWVSPKLASLHWDSKLLPLLKNKNIKEERLTVAVGDVNNVMVLGVPSYTPETDRSTGEVVSELTMNLLESWKCKEAIVNMVFDTTASNTGHLSGACVQIQNSINRSLLWSACRHHIGEVILSHVFNDLKIEVSKSPDILLFQRFRKNFDMIPHSGQISDLSIMKMGEFNVEQKAILYDLKKEAINVLKSKIDWTRDDYREFVELSLLFLNEFNGTNIKFQRPGALHKARWMAKLLYSIKICVLEQQISILPPGTVTTSHQVSKIRNFVHFVVLIYSPWWTTCSSAVEAPQNDLMLYKNILKYGQIDSLISNSAAAAFKRHLWYLNGEMIPLAIFSDKVPDPERKCLAQAIVEKRPSNTLLQPTGRFGMAFGKPKFPPVNSNTTLSSLVTEDSWFSLHLLRINTDFLKNEVADWATSESYISGLQNVRAINVINDAAERGVKLSGDYLSAARKECHYQNVVQVVQKNRHDLPNLRKRKNE